MLRWVGHVAVAVLEGGLQAWQRQGLPTEAGVQTVRSEGDLQLHPSLVQTVDTAGVLANLQTRARVVIDARSPDRYRGENEIIDPRAGHIPGALNRSFKNNLNPDGDFKSAAELRTEFVGLLRGVPPKNAIQQCGSGVSACHNLLAMEVAGLPGSALYPGSWSEWSADPSRPIATDAAL
jgi:thiosulfate/3-mercaptopyruvate sulfurtransferase